MEMIKSEWRTRLSNEALNDQLTILMSGTTIESFDPSPAFHLCIEDGIRKRRLAASDMPQQQDSDIVDYDADSELVLDALEDGRDMLRAVVDKCKALL